MADDGVIIPENLPEHFSARRQEPCLEDFLGTCSLKKAKRIVEQQLIEQAMAHSGGNRSRAAELLEISYPSLLQKLRELRISRA